MRITITYKEETFIAIADGAGLDVEFTGEYTAEKSDLGSELWNAIFDTRLDLHPEAEDHDTTPAELIEALRVMNLLPTDTCTCTMHQIENWGMCKFCEAQALAN